MLWKNTKSRETNGNYSRNLLFYIYSMMVAKKVTVYLLVCDVGCVSSMHHTTAMTIYGNIKRSPAYINKKNHVRNHGMRD